MNSANGQMKMSIAVWFAVLFSVIAMVVALDNPRAVAQQNNISQSQRSAEEIYLKHCASCHGKDGSAKTFKSKFVHARNFTDAQWQDSVTDERLFNSINNGKGKMPDWGKKLSEAEINSLVKYVRQFKK